MKNDHESRIIRLEVITQTISDTLIRIENNFVSLRSEMKADLDGLRSEMKADLGGLRTEMKADFRWTIALIISSFLGLLGFIAHTAHLF